METHAIVDGVELQNANGESCGGTFRESFAHSCNSVFAPLGLKIEAGPLVDAAERYGWNAKPTIPGEVPSTLPPAPGIDTPLELASTAIGQFETLATPLQMASVAQTIAMRGVRFRPTLSPTRRPRGERVTSRRVARTVGSMMVDVVAYGTGVAAALPDDEGGRQDRHGGARGHPRPGDGRDAAAGSGEHGRLVHLLRAGRPPEDRGGGDARPGGRRAARPPPPAARVGARRSHALSRT